MNQRFMSVLLVLLMASWNGWAQALVSETSEALGEELSSLITQPEENPPAETNQAAKIGGTINLPIIGSLFAQSPAQEAAIDRERAVLQDRLAQERLKQQQQQQLKNIQNNFPLTEQVQQSIPDSLPAVAPIITKVFQLEYLNANDLVKVIPKKPNSFFKTIADERNNLLIVIGTETEIAEVENLIQILDKPLVKDEPQSVSNIAYRVYIVENPTKTKTSGAAVSFAPKESVVLRPFTMTIEYKHPKRRIVSIEKFTDEEFKIDKINTSVGEAGSTDEQGNTVFRHRIQISGQCSSTERVDHFIKNIEEILGAEVVVSTLEMDTSQPAGNTGFYYGMGMMGGPGGMGGGGAGMMSGYGGMMGDDGGNMMIGGGMPSLGGFNPPPMEPVDVPIPEKIRALLNQLLGESFQLVGYWFGNSALPGECTATLGLWHLQLKTDLIKSADFQLNLQLQDTFGVQINNQINGKINQPIIIGYTRSEGFSSSSTLGAVVIVPQESFDVMMQNIPDSTNPYGAGAYPPSYGAGNPPSYNAGGSTSTGRMKSKPDERFVSGSSSSESPPPDSEPASSDSSNAAPKNR